MTAFVYVLLVTAAATAYDQQLSNKPAAPSGISPLRSLVNHIRPKRDAPEDKATENNEDSAETTDDGDDGVLVDTSLGTVKGGEFDNAINGKTFFAFLGIPFAEPPLGHLRFMAPKPAKPWEGVLNPEADPEPCIQVEFITQQSIGEEDCLKLSVFTPKYPLEVNEKDRLPVLVYIHGGYFHIGSISMKYGPDYLMTQEIVLVKIAYRLASFGFLSFQDELVPGNAGLKDQVLGLQWVKKNIAAFGGDPNKVTIFGHSAGAASVHLHMLSPMSTGLFHGVIAASGTAISSWVLDKEPNVTASILADVYNCSREGNAAVLKCLQAVDAYELGVTQYNAFPIERFEGSGTYMAFTPCIEPKNVQDTFISENPFKMLEAGKVADVPLMMGVTESELSFAGSMYVDDRMGSMILGLHEIAAGEFTEPPVQRTSDQLVLVLVLSFEMIPAKARSEALKYITDQKLSKRMMASYFGDEPPSLDNLDPVVKMLSDMIYVFPCHDSVTLHVKHTKSPVYEYMVTFDSNFSYVRRLLPFAPPKGVNHGDFVNSYIFYRSENPVDPEHEGQKMAMRAATMWANFADSGNPTPDDSLGVRWLPSQQDHSYYLNMGEKFKLEENLLHGREDIHKSEFK